jgi:predicted RND superfamily exporter protein
VVWVFGTMGWLGMPLGVATSMFCAITLGIGVDYAIHFLERFSLARSAGGPAAARRALAEAGPSIVIDCLAIALGFGLLAVSQVPANARLGILVAVALGACCLLTLAGLGALLPAVARRPAATVAPAPDGVGTPAAT